MNSNILNIKLVIFSVIGGELRILLKDNSLPAGLFRETLLDDYAENLFGKFTRISLRGIYYEQLYTFSFSAAKKRNICLTYYFLIPEHKIYSNIDNWKAIDDKNIKGIDREIVDYARQRLRWKIEYTNAVYSLLPEEFPFSRLQNVYEAILGRVLDKRNFRKKMLAVGILRETGHIKKAGRARPAEMFGFKKRKLTYVKIL